MSKIKNAIKNFIDDITLQRQYNKSLEKREDLERKQVAENFVPPFEKLIFDRIEDARFRRGFEVFPDVFEQDIEHMPQAPYFFDVDPEEFDDIEKKTVKEV
tara:strand:- start:3063 stop:3365 length:303 start_codon:yes stop_codon:yes gene_type:complete